MIDFIFKYKENINLYLKEENKGEYLEKINKEMKFIYLMLYPLRMLIILFEKRNATLCSLVPLTREYLEMMKDLHDKIKNAPSFIHNIFNEIVANVIYRIKKVAPEAAITEYVLTPLGRAELRKKGTGILTQNPGCLSLGYYQETLSDMKKYYEEMIETASNKNNQETKEHEIHNESENLEYDDSYISENIDINGESG